MWFISVCVWHAQKLLAVNMFIFIFELILFWQRMMALYVASHYKNSPNDLQLMADAPSHHLFVLLGMPFVEEPLPPFSLAILSEDDAHFSLSILDSIFVSSCAGPVDESKNQLPDILCVIQVYIVDSI